MAVEQVIKISLDDLKALGGIDNLKNALGETEKSTKSLKQQLREATAEVAQMAEKYGETSKQTIQAAKRAAELKDKIEDANDAILSFKGEGTFLATSKALQSVASGFAAAQGAIGLFGEQSADVEQAILKVQSAMALADGLAGLEDAGRSFKQLGTVLKSFTIVQKLSTAAQWLWNTAMAANPIGVVVVAVTALIAAGYALISYLKSSSEAADKQAAALKRSARELENQKKAAKNSVDALKENQDYQYKMAEATGKSSEELRKIALRHANETVALNYKNTMIARTTFLRERDTLATLKANDASDEFIKKQEEVTKKAYDEFKKQNEGLADAYKQRRKVTQDGEIEIAKENTDARKKEAHAANQRAEEAAEKRKQEQEKIKEELKRNKEIIKGIEDKSIREIEDLKAKTDIEKLRLQKERDLKEIEQVKLTAEEKRKAIIAVNAKYDLLEAEIKKTKMLESLKKATEQKQLDREKQLAEDEERTRYEVEQSIARAERTRIAEETNAKLIIDAKKNVLDNLITIFGAETEAGKAFLIAKQILAAKELALEVSRTIAFSTRALAESQVAVAEGSAKTAKVGFPQNIPLLIGYAAQAAAIIGAIKNAVKRTKAPISGVSSSIPSVGGASGGVSSIPTPQFNVAGNAGVNQIASTLANQPPIKAYVVGKEVSTQQSLDRNIVKNATLG